MRNNVIITLNSDNIFILYPIRRWCF